MDLNRLYRETPALHRYEFDWQGFEWIDCNDSDNSVFSFIRRADDRFVVVVVNLTPVPHWGYRIGVPQAGEYREIFNSDSAWYSGSNLGNGGFRLAGEAIPWMGRPFSLSITVPPLAGIVLQPI
jgi:1,4-alpha-glucan branching enzyme